MIDFGVLGDELSPLGAGSCAVRPGVGGARRCWLKGRNVQGLGCDRAADARGVSCVQAWGALHLAVAPATLGASVRWEVGSRRSRRGDGESGSGERRGRAELRQREEGEARSCFWSCALGKVGDGDSVLGRKCPLAQVGFLEGSSGRGCHRGV